MTCMTTKQKFNVDNPTVVMLKNELRSRGLKVSGRKAELVQRLEEDESTWMQEDIKHGNFQKVSMKFQKDNEI